MKFTNCLVCGEVILIEDNRNYLPLICPKCKEAVLYVRKQLDDMRDKEFERLKRFSHWIDEGNDGN